MARGMDIENVKFVISYDHPPYLTTYIHRVGRTARAGKAGTSVSFLEKSEVCFYVLVLLVSKCNAFVFSVQSSRNVHKEQVILLIVADFPFQKNDA